MVDGANSVYRGVEGSGEAFLFPQSHTDAINIYERVKANKQRQFLANQRQQQEDLSALSKVKPWVQDLGEFQKDRQDYLNLVTDAHKGKYTNDPVYMRKKLEMQDLIYAKQLRSSYHQKQYDELRNKITTQPEMYDDDALQKLEEYKNKPLGTRSDNLILPQLNPADGMRYLLGINPPAISKKGYTINSDGTKTVTSTTQFDEPEAIRLAEKEYQTNTTKEIKAVKKQTERMLISDLAAKGIDFNSLPPQEQEQLKEKRFVDHAVDVWKIKFKPAQATNLVNAPSNVAPKQQSLKEVQTSGLVTPKQINTVASDGSGKPSVITTAGTMEWPKGARGAGKVTLSKNSLYFDPTTNKFKKREEAGNMDFEPGETSVIKMADGKYAPYVFGKEVKLVDGVDANGNPVQKAVKEDIAVPLDEVKNLAEKNKVQHKWAFELADEKNKTTKPVFTRAQLTEKAKAAGYTYDEYLKLVKDKITLK